MQGLGGNGGLGKWHNSREYTYVPQGSGIVYKRSHIDHTECSDHSQGSHSSALRGHTQGFVHHPSMFLYTFKTPVKFDVLVIFLHSAAEVHRSFKPEGST